MEHYKSREKGRMPRLEKINLKNLFEIRNRVLPDNFCERILEIRREKERASSASLAAAMALGVTNHSSGQTES
jgi:hypothetical protein